jgi:TP901 family phage tail tape measure protein
VQTLLSTESATLRADRALSRYQKRIAEVQAAQMRAGTMVAGGIAVAGAAAIGAGIAQAAKFELAMTTVGLSLRASGDQLRTLQQTALRVSDVTAQSATTIAQEMGIAAQAGLNTLGVQRFNTLFPLLAKFADVQYFMAKGRGQDFAPTEAISYGVQFAHMFQAFTPARMQTMLEWITKLTTVTAESPQKALTQAKYFIPLGTALGLDMKDLFPLLAIMGQTGFLRGRGGTSIGQILLGAINAAALTGHAQSKKRDALIDLGILTRDGRNNVITAGGTLNWPLLQQILSGDATRMHPDRYVRDVKAAFNTQAAQFQTVMSTPAVQKQIERIRRLMEGLGNDPIGVFFDRMMNNFIPAFQKFVTNFVNLGINLFLPILPELTKDFTDWANVLGKIGTWLGAHPEVAKDIAHIAMALTGFMAARAVAGGLVMLSSAFGLLKGGADAVGLARALVFLDNVFLLGIGKRVIAFGSAVIGLNSPLSTASLGIYSLRAALVSLFTNPVVAAALTVLGTTSFMPHGDATKQLIDTYGYDYWRYLKGRHPGTNPYSFSTQDGDMSPQQFRKAHPAHHGTTHVSMNIILPKDSDAGHARRIAQLVKKEVGAFATVASYSIPTGSYNGVPVGA